MYSILSRIPRPPTSTLFPYTTLFRSWLMLSAGGKPIPFFGVELPALIEQKKAWAKLIKSIHETLGTAGYYLIGFHAGAARSEEHTSELQSRGHLVCRLLLETTTRSDT